MAERCMSLRLFSQNRDKSKDSITLFHFGFVIRLHFQMIISNRHKWNNCLVTPSIFIIISYIKSTTARFHSPAYFIINEPLHTIKFRIKAFVRELWVFQQNYPPWHFSKFLFKMLQWFNWRNKTSFEQKLNVNPKILSDKSRIVVMKSIISKWHLSTTLIRLQEISFNVIKKNQR